jgi:hypothetical protein
MVGMIVLLAATLLPAQRSLATSMEDWPVKFHPHLDLAATYDDNILIAHDNPLSDYYFTTSPGLELVYGDIAHNYLSADYTAGIERFVEHGSQDAINQYGTLKSAFEFNRLKLALNNQFQIETAASVEVGTRVREQRDLTDFSVEYLLNKYFSLGLLYHQEFHHFITPGQIDDNLFEPGGALYYHLLPKTDLYGEVDYGWVDEPQGENQRFLDGTVGVRGKLTSKITGRIGVGYEERVYSGPTANTETMVATVSLHGDFSRHTSADLTVTRQINPSVTLTNGSFTATRVEFIVNQKIYREKFLVQVGGSYEHDNYRPGSDRVDDVWLGSVGTRYVATKWLDFGVTYSYERDLSNTGTFSFGRNVVSVDGLLHF